MSIIDTLSKSVYPNEERNKIRFTKFLKNYSYLDLWNKISLAHLIKLLNFTEDPKFLKLKKYATSTLGTSDYPNEPRADYIDPDFETVEKLWPKDIKAIKGIKLKHLKHINLFYNYRNYIVHELRRPGGIWDDDVGHNIPYYYRLLCNNDKYFWKLVYPLGFFVGICQKALDNVTNYYLRNKVNPYDIFGQSDYLINLLN